MIKLCNDVEYIDVLSTYGQISVPNGVLIRIARLQPECHDHRNFLVAIVRQHILHPDIVAPSVQSMVDCCFNNRLFHSKQFTKIHIAKSRQTGKAHIVTLQVVGHIQTIKSRFHKFRKLFDRLLCYRLVGIAEKSLYGIHIRDLVLRISFYSRCYFGRTAFGFYRVNFDILIGIFGNRSAGKQGFIDLFGAGYIFLICCKKIRNFRCKLR